MVYYLRPLHSWMYPFNTFRLCVFYLGLLINLLFIFLVSKSNLHSLSCKALVTSQAVLDALTCVSSIIYLHLSEQLGPSEEVVPRLYCNLWISNFLFYLPFMLGLNNLIAQSVDRLWAVYRPASYKATARWRLVGSYASILIIGVLVALPMGFLAHLHEGRCFLAFDEDMPLFAEFLDAYPSIWCVFTFIVPVVIFLAVFFLICVRLLRTRGERSTGPSKPSANDTMVRRLIITTMVNTVTYSICIAPYSIYYLLGSTRRVYYIFGSPAHAATTFLSVLNSCLTPIVFLAYFKRFRQTAWNMLRTAVNRVTGRSEVTAAESQSRQISGTINNGGNQ